MTGRFTAVACRSKVLFRGRFGGEAISMNSNDPGDTLATRCVRFC
jgi:hypothetical protein